MFPQAIHLINKNISISVQSLSCVRLFAIPWTAACQASLSITNSRSLLKLMSIESMMPYIHMHLHTFSEKAMATHSSTLAWKIPWTEEPGRLQSMGSLRVGHDWRDLAAAAGLPVHHYLPEFTQTHVHQVGDAIQPSHTLSYPSPAPKSLPASESLQWVNSSHEVAKVLEFQL